MEYLIVCNCNSRGKSSDIPNFSFLHTLIAGRPYNCYSAIIKHVDNISINCSTMLFTSNPATRYVSKFVLCSRAIGVLNASNSKSDLQGHSVALAMISFDRSYSISC